MHSDIFIRFTVPGWHHWPKAKGKRAYLKHDHRHLFHVEVTCEVSHDDREIEFHDLMDQAKALLGDCRFGAKSCEAITRLIGQPLAKKYARVFKVTVSEDNECGAITYFHPDESSS